MKEAIKNFVWLLFLAITVPIIAAYLLKKYKKYNNKAETNDEIERYIGENYNSEKKKKEIIQVRPDFDYDQKFVMPRNIENKIIIMDYEKFNLIYKEHAFIKKYLSSIIKTISYKKDYYIEKLLEVNRKILQSKTDSPLLEYDVEFNRLNKYKAIIKIILDAIKRKIRTLNYDDLQNRLKYILEDSQKGFKSVRGRKDFKDFLCRQIFSFVKNPMIFNKNSQNIILMGKSGTGKTKLARLMGDTYSRCGIFMRDVFNEAKPEQLTSEFAKSSGNMTKEFIESSLEGVCYIDEVHDLAGAPSMMKMGADHGLEAVNSIVSTSEDYDGKIVIAVSGYEDKVRENFLAANSGLDRRFPHKFVIGDYSYSDLTDILIDFLYSPDNNFILNNSEAVFINRLIKKLYGINRRFFEKQAGSMKILSSKILTSHLNSLRKSNDKFSSIIFGFNEYLSSYNYVINDHFTQNMS